MEEGATPVWIHDINIVNDDDSIAIKPSNKGRIYSSCSENIVIENAVISGFGMSIGSVNADIQHNCVRNVTFRNITLPQSGKGIYIKNNGGCEQNGATAEITDIVYQDIYMDKPLLWAIWIGSYIGLAAGCRS